MRALKERNHKKKTMATPDSDQGYMALALDLARKGLGRTSPNPCVGAVIVRDGRIIGSGYHRRAGTPHAEVHALRQAGSLAAGATLYVTLEPCNHTGRTPPCSHAVAESGISRVVMGMLDPNPLVAGGGRQYLIDNGIEVTTNILEGACRRLNEPFIKYITSKRPLVVIKAGVSLDGRLNYQKGRSGWITGADSLHKVHQLRDCYDAILVGRGTVEIDNPSLTTRLQDRRGRDPLRLVVDSRLSTSPDARMLNQQSEAETWIFCTSRAPGEKRETLERKGARIFEVDGAEGGRVDLTAVMALLGEKQITSVLVEGGGAVFSALLAERLADKAQLFYAPLFAGNGGESLTADLQITGRDEAVRLGDVDYTGMGEDLLVEGTIIYPQN